MIARGMAVKAAAFRLMQRDLLLCRACSVSRSKQHICFSHTGQINGELSTQMKRKKPHANGNSLQLWTNSVIAVNYSKITAIPPAAPRCKKTGDFGLFVVAIQTRFSLKSPTNLWRALTSCFSFDCDEGSLWGTYNEAQVACMQPLA